MIVVVEMLKAGAAPELVPPPPLSSSPPPHAARTSAPAAATAASLAERRRFDIGLVHLLLGVGFRVTGRRPVSASAETFVGGTRQVVNDSTWGRQRRAARLRTG